MLMPSPLVAIGISASALIISFITLWLTYFRKGRVHLTRPAVIYFGPDGSRNEGVNNKPKIFLRALLIATAKRGRVVENMFVTLSRQETRQSFSIWVYGEDTLVRGSGLHVSDVGVATNHHFLLPSDNSEFRFKDGNYQLEVFATLLGDKKPIRVLSQNLVVSPVEAVEISSGKSGLYFDWGPQSGHYIPHLKPSSLPQGRLGRSIGES